MNMAKLTTTELRALMSELSTDSVAILKETLEDPLAPKKIKLEVARFIIETCLDDDSVTGTSDNLMALVGILTPPALVPAQRPKKAKK